MGEEDPAKLREIGKLLAYLKEPDHSWLNFRSTPCPSRP
jgi:hypothetical protein